MLRIVTKNKLYFIGNFDDFLEILEELQLKYSTLKEVIDDLLNN